MRATERASDSRLAPDRDLSTAGDLTYALAAHCRVPLRPGRFLSARVYRAVLAFEQFDRIGAKGACAGQKTR